MGNRPLEVHLNTKFKIGDIIQEKDPFTDEILKYKVLDIFQNYWEQYVYELECLNPSHNEYGTYRPKDLSVVVDNSFTLVEDSTDDSRNISK